MSPRTMPRSMVLCTALLCACRSGGGGNGGDNVTPGFGCALTEASFAGYELMIPPRSDLEIGAELAVDGVVLEPGLPSDQLDVNRSYSQLSCTDTSTLHGRITFGIAGLLGLGTEGTRQAAQALVLDTIEIVRVGNVTSLVAEDRRKYAWEGIRVRSMTFDAARVSGVDAQFSLNRLSRELGISGGVGSDSRLHLHGEELFVAWRARKFQETESRRVATFVAEADDRKRDFELGPYHLLFQPEARAWSVTVTRLSDPTGSTYRLDGAQPSIVVGRRQLAGALEEDRVRIRDLVLPDDDSSNDGVVGHFALDRRTVPFQSVRVDETRTN